MMCAQEHYCNGVINHQVIPDSYGHSDDKTDLIRRCIQTLFASAVILCIALVITYFQDRIFQVVGAAVDVFFRFFIPVNFLWLFALRFRGNSNSLE